MRGQRLTKVILVAPCVLQEAGSQEQISCHTPAPHQPPSHLVHTAEQLPVEGSKMVGNIFGLHPVDLCVSRGDLDLLRKGYLAAGGVRGTWLPVVR